MQVKHSTFIPNTKASPNITRKTIPIKTKCNIATNLTSFCASDLNLLEKVFEKLSGNMNYNLIHSNSLSIYENIIAKELKVDGHNLEKIFQKHDSRTRPRNFSTPTITLNDNVKIGKFHLVKMQKNSIFGYKTN